MFNGKTIKYTETCTVMRYNKEDEVESVTFYFTDGSNLKVETNKNGLDFSTFDEKSKRTSHIHPYNLVE